MLETTRYEAGRRLRGTAVLTVSISVYAAFVVWYFTTLEGVDYESVFENLPPAMIEAFGIEALGTIEGFLGAQIFNFVWLLGLGVYFAYAAAGLLAGDVENGRLDLVLSFPVSRSQLLLEKSASLLLPLTALNVVVGVVLYVLVLAIGESIDPAHLALAHLLSVPYLLACGAIGLLCSVLANRAAIAERAAIGVVFVLYLLESVIGGGTQFAWLQHVSPTNYYDPTPLLIAGTYDALDSVVLLVMFLALFAASRTVFQRRDV
jgi:ABC-2 type transport system permease protein